MLLEIGCVTTDREHDAALKRLNALWGATEGEALDELNILSMLVDRYESERWSAKGVLDPIEIIEGFIAHAGHTRAGLDALLGSAGMAGEILARKRPLTLDMVRTISAAWGISPELLTPSYRLAMSGPAGSAAEAVEP